MDVKKSRVSYAVFYEKPFLPYNFKTFNMENNPKNNILMSGKCQTIMSILEYFDAYTCHHCNN